MKLLDKADFSVLENLKTINFGKAVKSSYAPDRVEKWYGYFSNLKSIKEGRSELAMGDSFPDWLEACKDKYFKEANSALICSGCKPKTNTSIEWHRDHGHFYNKVVMINFGEAMFYVQTYDEGTLIKKLVDCDVVEFDSKFSHKSQQISTERYIVTLRQVKREFLTYKLF